MKLRQAAVRGVAWTTLREGGTQIVSFIVFATLSRLLDPVSFGLVAIANAFLILVQVFLDQGFGDALIQREEVEPGHLNAAFWTTGWIGLVTAVITYVGSGLIANLYQEPALEAILRVIAVNVFIRSLVSTQQTILRREMAFGKLAARTLIAETVGGVTGIIMALRGFGVWSLVVRTLVRDVIGLVALWRVSPWRPTLQFSRTHLRDLRWFGLIVMGQRGLLFVNSSMDKLLIGYFLGTTILGYYAIAIRLVQLMLKLLHQSIAGVTFPVFSRLQVERDRIARAYYQGVRLSSFAIIPAFTGVSLLAYEVMIVLFGVKWEPSAAVLQILALIGVVRVLTFLSPAVLMALGKPNWHAAIHLTRALGTALAIMVTVGRGLTSVAFGLVVVELILIPLVFMLHDRAIGLDLNILARQFRPALGGTIAMVAVVIGLRELISGHLILWLSFGLNIGVGAFVYLAVVRALDRSLIGMALDALRLLFPASAES
jgi:PST family polysaccharide transporter